MTAIKMSLVLFYLRIFGIKRGMRLTVYVLITLLILWFLAQVIYIMLECRPIAFFWNYTLTSGHCNTASKVSGYSINGASLVLDLVIWVVPIHPLWGLKRDLGARISLIGIFLVGAL